MGICSKFMTYAEKVISEAKELTTAIPELYDYPVVYFKQDDPDVAYLQKFAELDKFEIRDFFSQKVLQIKNPTVSDVYWEVKSDGTLMIAGSMRKKPRNWMLKNFTAVYVNGADVCRSHIGKSSKEREISKNQLRKLNPKSKKSRHSRQQRKKKGWDGKNMLCAVFSTFIYPMLTHRKKHDDGYFPARNVTGK